MTVSPHPEQVRELVIGALQRHGVPSRSASRLRETILIDDGRYMARSYRLRGYMAMWLVEVGIVQFYDAQGNMLETLNLFEELKPQRMAA